jgi:DNA-binding transcriptional ArsR family regulator
VFERVAAGPATVAEITPGLPVLQPAVSQHLKVLREAGLVQVVCPRAGAFQVFAAEVGHW